MFKLHLNYLGKYTVITAMSCFHYVGIINDKKKVNKVFSTGDYFD